MLMLRNAILMFSTFLVQVAFSQSQVALQADAGRVTISRNIYGHFAEHLGNCIYNGFYVGDSNRVIPNTNGVRNDIIAALRKLKIPNLRWPGGCFADTYHWKDGVGPKKDRPAMVNRWWGGVTEDNSFGTHDFLNMCELLGAEPYLSGNVGSGTVQEMADWLQYVNGNPGAGPMSSWRVRNGRKEAWNVPFWGVGNEAWGCGGNMRPEYYANVYRQYATYLTPAGSKDKVFRIASGASDGDYNWTEVLMRDIPRNLVEGVAMHHYAVIDWNAKSPAATFTEQQYFATMKQALRMEEFIRGHSAIMDKYDPEKKTALVVDEWGGWYDVEQGTNPGFLFQQNTLRDAMIAGVTLNIFNNHADRVRMANLAQTVNVLQAVILTRQEKMILTPTYHVMEMYNVHQDATLIPVTVRSEDYVLGTEKLPAVSVSASRDKGGQTHVSLVNIDAGKVRTVTVDVGERSFSSVYGRILTGKHLQDHNDFNAPENLRPAEFLGAKLKGGSLQVDLPPFSVVVLTLH
jgi:alpha-N-arabinofuranosidase